MFKKVFYISLLVALTSIAGLAQGTAKISGTVKDSNDAAVTGATVTALNIASNQRVTTVTDGSGKYEFSGLRGGSYRVVATSQGFAESAETIVLADDGNVTQDFSISPGAIRDVVTVTAGKGSERIAAETPQTVTVVSADQIEQRLPRSTMETLERAPNLGTIETNPARERPRLRGLSSTRLLVVIDGERLNNARADPGASGAQVAIVDPSQLEAVEVVAGSGSSLYGSDSIGGTINLITKKPTLSEKGLIVGLRIDGTYTSNGAIRRGNATLNIGGSNVAFRASGNMYRNANYNMGNGELTLQENIRFGNFFRQFPTNAAGTSFQSAASYPIFALPKNFEIGNGQGHGGGQQFDLWFYPTQKHNLRGRYLGRNEGNHGNAFSGPPYETQERYTEYREFNKFSLRYEGLDLAKFLPRVAANFYYQKISSPQNQYTFNNLSSTSGGSYVANTNPNLTSFTGTASVFGVGSYTDNRNTIGSTGIDVQASLLPFTGMLVTVGGGRTKDNSRDYFYTSPFTGFGPARQLTVSSAVVGASSPISNYVDNNFYVQAEFDRIKWVRFTGGMRYDNWVTEGLPGNGFPLSTEFAALNAAIPGLTASPGALGSLVSALPDLARLTGGTGSVGSNRNSTTYNFGIVGRLPWGVNPYFRWANSYREPGITERYLIRNFTPGVAGLASLVVGNPNLLPEKGENYDVGVKIAQRRFNFTLGYFHNEITDLLRFAPAQTYCVAPILPGLPGGFAGGCGAEPVNRLGVQINARINTAAAVIKGWESTGEASIPLGTFGSVNPFYTLGALHGTNKNPTAIDIAQFNAIYNRSDTPIKLTGSLTDFPLGSITPFRIIYGAQFLDSKGRVSVEYNVRHQNRVTRADPAQFVGTALINYGSFASTNTFDKHSLKGGYTWRNDRYKFTINAGIDNIADKLYWEHFQNAPAPGRSFVFGFSTEIFNFLKK